MSRRPALVLLTAAATCLVLGAACSGGGSNGATTGTAVTFAPAGQGGATSTPSQTVTVPGSGSSSATPTSAAPPATLPASVDPGTGVLVVGASSVSVGITVCNLTPETDAATGVTTDVLVTGSDDKGGTLTISQRETANAGGATTITERVTYTRGADAVETSRIEINGTYHDLRDPSINRALLEVHGDEIRASGTFGLPGSVAGDPSLSSGAVLARCPSP